MLEAIAIYGLVDPRSSEVRYIGRTAVDRLGRRVKEHLWEARRGRKNVHRGNWLRQLDNLALRPGVRILEIVDGGEDWEASERWWIGFGRDQGWPLTNISEGGDGCSGHTMSPETRARISIAMSGRQVSDVTRARLSAANKGQIQPPLKNAGSTNGQARLTEAQVVAIRETYAEGGITQAQLGREYGVSGSTIKGIVHGQRWKHAGGPVTPPGFPYNRKLTEGDVRAIRQRYALGDVTQAQLGREYGVTHCAVSAITRGKNWKGVL